MITKRKFVVLFHEMPEDSVCSDHWDLMLECDGYLETWTLGERPEAGKTLTGTKLAPHRMEYLSYEGSVSDNRGSVKRVVAGHFAGEIAPADSPLDYWLEFWIQDEQQSVRFLRLDEINWEIRF